MGKGTNPLLTSRAATSPYHYSTGLHLRWGTISPSGAALPSPMTALPRAKLRAVPQPTIPVQGLSVTKTLPAAPRTPAGPSARAARGHIWYSSAISAPGLTLLPDGFRPLSSAGVCLRVRVLSRGLSTGVRIFSYPCAPRSPFGRRDAYPSHAGRGLWKAAGAPARQLGAERAAQHATRLSPGVRPRQSKRAGDNGGKVSCQENPGAEAARPLTGAQRRSRCLRAPQRTGGRPVEKETARPAEEDGNARDRARRTGLRSVPRGTPPEACAADRSPGRGAAAGPGRMPRPHGSPLPPPSPGQRLGGRVAEPPFPAGAKRAGRGGGRPARLPGEAGGARGKRAGAGGGR